MPAEPAGPDREEGSRSVAGRVVHDRSDHYRATARVAGQHPAAGLSRARCSRRPDSGRLVPVHVTPVSRLPSRATLRTRRAVLRRQRFRGRQSPPPPTEFLQRTAEEGSRGKGLTCLIAAAEAGHPGLKPLWHANSGAYLLANLSPSLLAQNSCQAGAMVRPQPGVLLAFHFSHSRNASAGVVALIWRRVDGQWRITAYSVADD